MKELEGLSDKLTLPWEKKLAQTELEKVENKFTKDYLKNVIDNAESIDQVKAVTNYVKTGKGLPLFYHSSNYSKK